jgi:Flp pilus assembly protein TadD
LRDALGALTIGVLGVLAYVPAFRAGFVFDDHEIIENGRLLRGPLSVIWVATTGPDYWPLTYSAFWAEWRVFGPDPTGYHLVSVALHILVAVLLWRTLRRLGIHGAWLAGLLFAVHPVAVESVAWISEQKNTLSGVFWLATILAWIELDDDRVGWRRVVALGLFVLAVLAKASVVPLPVVLLGITLARRGRIRRDDLLELAPFFAVAVAGGLLNVWFQHAHAMAGGWAPVRSLAERIGGAARALASYLTAAFAPVRLAIVHAPWPVGPTSPWFWAPPAALAVGFALLWRVRSSAWGRAALLAIGYQAVCVGPVLGLIDMSFFRIAPVSNHLAYLGLMGPVAFAGWALMQLQERAGKWGVAAVAAVTVALGATTFHRASAFEDDLTLWQAAVREAPDSALARQSLGDQLIDRGRVAEGVAELKRAAALSPDPAFRHGVLSSLQLMAGRKDEAAAEARQVLAAHPAPSLASDAGSTLLETGHTDEAIAVFRDLVQRAPNASEYAFRLSVALARAGRTPEAADALLAYCNRNPGHPRMEPALTMLLLRLGRIEEARAHAGLVLGIDAADPRADEQVRAWYAQATGGAPPPPGP